MKISWIFDTGFQYDDEGRAPGWIVPLTSLMIVTMTGLIFLQFRIPPGWPVTLLAAVETIVTQAFVRRRLNRVWKRGYRGVLRGGTWIEIAAICWVVWASACCFSGVARFRAAQLPQWQQGLLETSDSLVGYIPPCALACSLIGMILGVLRRRPFHGPAMHIVAFFFWGAVIIFAGMALIPQNAGWVIVVAEIVAIVGVTALIAAAVLAWTGKKKSSEE